MTTWLITGCSTGLGRALAHAVLDHGDNAVVTARDAAKVSPEATGARQSIGRRLERFIAQGHAERGIRAPVNATDVIVFSALVTRPLPHNPGWQRLAARQVATFLNGLAGNGPIEVPGPPVARSEIERAFVRTARPADEPGG